MSAIPEKASQMDSLWDYLMSLPPDLNPYEVDDLALIFTLQEIEREIEERERQQPSSPPLRAQELAEALMMPRSLKPNEKET